MTLEYIIQNAGLTIGTNVAQGEVNLRTDVSFPMIGSEFITTGCEYCTLFEPTATNMQKEKNGYVLDPVGKYSGSVPYTCFVATESYLKEHGEQAEKFLKAVYRGYEYISTQTATKAAEALQASFSGMTIAELEIAVNQYLDIEAWSSDFYLTESSYETLLDILNKTEGKRLGTTYTAKYSSIVDMSIATKLA